MGYSSRSLDLQVQFLLHSSMHIQHIRRHGRIYFISFLYQHCMFPFFFLLSSNHVTVQKVFKVDCFVSSHENVEVQVRGGQDWHTLALKMNELMSL